MREWHASWQLLTPNSSLLTYHLSLITNHLSLITYHSSLLPLKMKESIAFSKSEEFGKRIIDLYEYLKIHKAPYTIIDQITRSGTSIGANLSEALYGISDKDFLAKVYIALKESNETKYWLRLLYSAQKQYIDDDLFASLSKDLDEIIKILSAITKTLSLKLKSPK